MTTIDQGYGYELYDSIKNVRSRLPTGSKYHCMKPAESIVKDYLNRRVVAFPHPVLILETKTAGNTLSELQQVTLPEMLTETMKSDLIMKLKLPARRMPRKTSSELQRARTRKKEHPGPLDSLLAAFDEVDPKEWKKLPRNASLSIDKVVYDD